MAEVIAGIGELRARLTRERGRSTGLVPTMGALHRGHAALLDAARRENDFVVASIFVNPIQFDRREDLENYPRTMEEDLRVCESRGVDLVFAPLAAELIRELMTFVESPLLEHTLRGAPAVQGIFAGGDRSIEAVPYRAAGQGVLGRKMRSNWRLSGAWWTI